MSVTRLSTPEGKQAVSKVKKISPPFGGELS